MAILFATANLAAAEQIDIPSGVFVALDQPDIGMGPTHDNKHTTWAHNPIDGRLYSIGGDYPTLDEGAAQSYQQTQFSLSIEERWANRSDRNAGYRLEYPYCGPDGGVQPKSPDFVGWTWDSIRRVFWFVPGTCVEPIYAAPCSDRTATQSDDPKYKYRHLMTFNPAEPQLSERWTDWGRDTTPWRSETWMSVHDPVTDTIIRFGNGEVVDIFDVKSRTWSTLNHGSNAVGGTVRIYSAMLSPDFVNRVIYLIDGTAGRLMRWNMDQKTLSDLGLVPDGPITPIGNAYSVWDSINQVLLFFHENQRRLHVYHPDTAMWETPPIVTDPPDLTPYVRHAMVFDPYQNVLAMLGNTDPGNRHIYLYRYANGSGSPPIPPSNLRIVQ